MQLEFQRTARDFTRKELLPNASLWDEKKYFPVETLRAAAQLGFAGLYIRCQPNLPISHPLMHVVSCEKTAHHLRCDSAST